MLTVEQLNELKSLLMSDESSYVSSIFNENVQSAWAKRPLEELKFAPRISEKLLFPVLMSFPFNPLTGKTDVYNDTNKYVAPAAPSDVIDLIKAECSTNPELANLYKRKAKFRGNWDTSPTESSTAEDKDILWIYRRRMTYAIPAMKIISKAISGNAFPAIYLLNTKQDPITGEFIGDISTMHKIGNLVGALYRKEINSFNDGIDDKDIEKNISYIMKRPFALSPDFLSVITSRDSIDAKSRRSEIKSFYSMEAPAPLLPTIGIKFSLTPKTGTFKMQVDKSKYELYDHFLDKELDFKKHIFFSTKYSCTKAIDEICGNYFPKDPRNYKERDAQLDLYPNFVALDYITENTNDTFTKDERMNAAKDMTYASEKKPLYDLQADKWADPELENFMNRVSKFHSFAYKEDLFTSLHDLLYKSFGHVSDAMVSAAIDEIRIKLPLSSPMYTPEIIAMHSEILLDLFPKEMITKNSSQLVEENIDGDELYEKLLKESEAAAYDGVNIASADNEGVIEIDDEEEEYETISK